MTLLILPCFFLLIFQLTSSRGGWLDNSEISLPSSIFQLTSSRGGWLTLFLYLMRCLIFQLTSSRGGWQTTQSQPMASKNFNSHPHEEDDNAYVFYSTMFFISTHILTRRMTEHGFIRAKNHWHFNSHPHEEDDIAVITIVGIGNISTHILTRRMTFPSIPAIALRVISTHILTRRMTQVNGISGIIFIFQLTSSRGGWLVWYSEEIWYCHFNSHPHEEDDNAKMDYYTIRNISTHILTRRMTKCNKSIILNRNISTHILTRRMTGSVGGKKDVNNISTHILTRRMTTGGWLQD